MRLLELKSSGKCNLTRDLIDNIPPYAILSHTWGEDNEEVTFQDLMQGASKSKVGYNKIRFCQEQAVRDGIWYIWVDTCCIDKANNTELSEAINSMFRWYREAAKCYVYLSDVSIDSLDKTNRLPGLSCEAAFRKSRWFTRGWTLQELIAPISVEFFSKEGERLGNKRSLERYIQEITGIPISALQGTPLSHFSVSDRISWAEHRETRRKEDKVYSLLGIFDVHIPLIYGEGREKAFTRLHDEIDKLTRNFQLPNVQPIIFKVSWIVPFERNSRFIGRESQLAKLEERAFGEDRTTKIAITGLGGVGKTQLAIEMAFRTRAKYENCSIFWIPAINMESVEQAYLGIAQQLGIPGWEENKVDVKRLVQGYLNNESAGQWLLIFDNADNIDMWIDMPKSERKSGRLMDYLPRSKQGCIVFTTRDRKTAVKLVQQDIVELLEMSEGVATQLLKKHLLNQNLNSNEQDVKAMLAQLTYLPLAIVQAAAYINENGITLADYLSLFKDQEEEVIGLLSEEFEDNGRYRNVQNPVATTWLISFEQIRQRDPLAAEFLSFMACVDPKNVPQSLLPPGPSRRKETEAIGTLDAYSFINRRSEDLAFDIHRLVHLAMRSWLRKEGLLAQWAERTVRRLENVFPNNDHQNRSVWRRYLMHAHYAIQSNLIDQYGQSRIDLASKVGMCLFSDGRYYEAEVLFMKVMETRKRVLGLEHPDTLKCMYNLALTFGYQGRWEKAEELGMQVILTGNRVLGSDHPDMLIAAAKLTLLYTAQGRWKRAEELGTQAVKAHILVLGQEHPDTLTSICNLTLTILHQGRWKEAEELQIQVIETRKRVLGEEHPDTLTSLGNLASTFWSQGRWKEAEELEVQVMETRKRVLGEEHPDTLISLGNLALIFRSQGRWKEAEELEVQVMEKRKRVLGEEHPDSLTSMNNLAWTWEEQGRDTEAIELIGECVQLRTRILGVDHPATVSSSTALIRWKTKKLDTSASGIRE